MNALFTGSGDDNEEAVFCEACPKESPDSLESPDSSDSNDSCDSCEHSNIKTFKLLVPSF